ncbi:MAG TPA: lycopene cyclase family protein [Solirubrobacterales bacterium]|jgi:flavin-dependent dehydrogenase|nr:lycopene cyclase family protein [Solirubrobacterales bacterium]
MPRRRTKRGAQRVPLGGEHDVVVCGASFAGLAVARELSGTGARVLLLDRYEIGERQTSACAAPTEWLRAMGVADSIRQTFSDLVVHTPHTTVRMHLPWTFSTFDYPSLCAQLFKRCDASFETATVEGRSGADVDDAIGIASDRGPVAAPLVVDALGWRRVLDDGYQPPDAPLSRGLEVHPHGSSQDLEIWIERDVIPAGYGWSFPADDEVRVGVGSFIPRDHVKRPTVELAQRLERPSVRYQGNWIPHRLREATSRDVFFAGDSAGHCLPLTAEGIRTAFYFGIACGRELRRVVEGRADRATALRRYAAFSARHRWQFESMLRVQRLVPRVPPRLLGLALRGMSTDAFVRWSFSHYLDIAHPAYAREYAGRDAPQALRAAA